MTTTEAPARDVAPHQAPHPQSHKGLIVLAAMLTTALSALDANIVGTAIPSIVGELRGLALLPWLVTAFLLSSTVSIPLYGKLADIYGRKPVLLIGVTIFLVGSALCGLAGSMEQLILFRALQGLGAGSVVPVTLTLIGDLFAVEERARLQGIFSAVWGVSSVLGPLAGGFIVTAWSWPWVFLINVPFGLLAMAILGLYLREPLRPRADRPALDIAGAVTLTLGTTAALLALTTISNGATVTSPAVLGLVAVAVALIALFVRVERGAREPLVPLDLLTTPLSRVSAVSGVLASGGVFGGGAYLAMLVQGVWQGTPLQAGLALAPLSFGWPLASTMAGRLLLRYGYRPVIIGGTVFILLGALLLLPLGADGPVWLLPVGMFVQGLGFGTNFSCMLIAVQNAVPWNRRGAATSVYQFSRNMGGTLTVAIMGLLLTGALSGALAHLPAAVAAAGAGAGGTGAGAQLGAASVLLDLHARGTLAPETRAALIAALMTGIRPVIWTLVILGAGTLGATAFFPRDVRPR